MADRHALVIDDEADVRTYLETLLTDNGWRVQTAGSADDGLALARAEAPDVVLLDVMMPERGGLSTLVALRKDPRTNAVPVILVTGIQETLTQDFEAFLDRFKHHNPDAYVKKPFQPEELLKVVDRVVSPKSGD